nr:MAG: hypothetical protein [Lake Baikal virophage 5]
MEDLTLEQLTLKYFEMERDIDKMTLKKQEYEKEITEQYNNKGKLYVLIRKKQNEQEQAIKDKQLKLKEAIVENTKYRREKRSESIRKRTEERLAIQKEDNELCNQAIESEDLKNWNSIKNIKLFKTQKIKKNI